MQAVVITAYKNISQVSQLAKRLSECFDVYIHVDKKLQSEDWKCLNSINERIKAYSVYNVNWGGCNHLKAILYLLKVAMRQPYKYSYFHIISGQDWPARSVREIYRFFEDTQDVYMAGSMLSKIPGRLRHKVVSWQKYYSFLDVFDYKNLRQKIFVKLFVKLQSLMKINRLEQLDFELCRGLVWGSIPRDALAFCFDYIEKHPEFMDFLEVGHASEEFFFLTILMNSETWKNKVKNTHLRYILWEKKNGSYPAILDIQDLKAIQSGNYMFVRKVEFPISEELVKALDLQ